MNTSKNTKKNSRTKEEKEKARLKAFRDIKPRPNTNQAGSITTNSGELPPTIQTVFKKKQLPQIPQRKIKNNKKIKLPNTKINKLVLPNNNRIAASLKEQKLSSQNQTLKLSNPPPKPPRAKKTVLPHTTNNKENGDYSTFGEIFINTPPTPPPRRRNSLSSKQFRTERVNPVSPNNKRIATSLKKKKKEKLL